MPPDHIEFAAYSGTRSYQSKKTIIMDKMVTYIIPFNKLSMRSLNQVGGKNASLGEMLSNLSEIGILVPDGFATTADAYYEFLTRNKLVSLIKKQISQVNENNFQTLSEISENIREAILAAPLQDRLIEAVTKAYAKLNLKNKVNVAVRSSATIEDLPQASFAGQQETFLNIKGLDNVLTAIKKVYASLYTKRAIIYRLNHHFENQKFAMSVGIQQMIRSDIGASGVIFTIDTETGFDKVIFITAAYGLGETVVQGKVDPDEFYVYKPMLAKGKPAIISRKVGSKAQKMILENQHNHHAVKIIDVPLEAQQRFCLEDEDIIQLAQYASAIETHYGKPMDIEWGKDGKNGQLYILQARPETVQSNQSKRYLENYRLTQQGEILIEGRSVGQRIGKGKACILDDPKNMEKMVGGSVLVASMTDPDWEPIMKKSAAIVTNHGGRTCHAAIVARELGIPAIVGCGHATQVIKDNMPITVSCAEGEIGHVYNGLLDFNVDKREIGHLPTLPFKLCMNLANPQQAFTYQFLPNDGIGLARLEFIIGNMIGIHPNALLNYANMPNAIQKEIDARTRAYASPKEFYIEKLTEGIATIAAAFYPKPVIVRFSDFKTNEYINLLGGEQFEPKEENPMLGYRGAARYLTGNFQDSFLLECEAIKRVRHKLGLTNTHIMFPFVRTVEEAGKLIDLISQHGLRREKNGLQVYMMCEIPSNALLAEEFLAYFDGYSIGSNDLTQLTLGIDRDSELVAKVFDERNQAVKKFLHDIIHTCRKMDKYVGICGQGPSDHPDLAQWLMKEGITAISLTPDVILKTWLMLSDFTPYKKSK